MTPFQRAYRWEQTGSATWAGQLDAGWGQGRSTFGGLQAAVAVHGMQGLVEPGRPLRTLHVVFCGALSPGAATMEAGVERAGRSVSVASARIRQDGQVCAVATGVFAQPRDHAWAFEGEPAPAFGAPLTYDIPPAVGAPALIQHVYLDLRYGIPLSGATKPAVGGWVRLRGEEPLDAPTLAATADIWPPAVLALATGRAPSSTVDLTVDFLHPPPLDLPDGSWLAFHAETTAGRDGYVEERGSCWDESGRLVLRTRQLRAVY